jgi:hypothetical protein
MLARSRIPIVLLLIAFSLCACAGNGANVKRDEIPIACRLDVFTDSERVREAELLQEHLASVVEIQERPDGYSFRYPADPALFARMAELVSLEHRCCPFLDFHLEWAGADASPWLHVTGSAAAKEFIGDAFRRHHDVW